MDSLIKLFSDNIELTNEDIKFIKANSHVSEYPKNHLLLKKGETSKAFYFVLKGCLRLFYSSQLDEKTAYFYTENMFVSSFLSFTKQSPAEHNIATIEASTLVVFDSKSVEKFMNFSPKFGIIAKIMMEEELISYQQMISSFITQNAEERYLDFLKSQPNLMKRIPQHQIATFLGVSPETLSRIRKRIVSR
jgi:CRP-like cAMP-binding protein